MQECFLNLASHEASNHVIGSDDLHLKQGHGYAVPSGHKGVSFDLLLVFSVEAGTLKHSDQSFALLD
jgi:hypothetical protein